MATTINHLGTVSDLPNFGEGGVEYFGQTFVAERVSASTRSRFGSTALAGLTRRSSGC